MEQWLKSNKMIRPIGEKEDPHEWLNMYKERLVALENLSSTHIQWFTHKNPYGCWICDMIQVMYALTTSFGEFLGPIQEEPVTDQTKFSLGMGE